MNTMTTTTVADKIPLMKTSPGTFFLFLFCSSCLSIPWEYFQDKKAHNIRFQKPEAPYQRQKHKTMEAFWKNPEDPGGFISFFTTCLKHEPGLSLPQFQGELLSNLKGLKVLSSSSALLKTGGESRRHLQLQSPPSKPFQKMKLVLLKKTNCFYVLVFLTKKKNSSGEEEVFKNFTNRFEVL